MEFEEFLEGMHGLTDVFNATKESSNKLLELLYNIYYEQQKTNIILSQITHVDNKKEIAFSDEYLGKNILVEGLDNTQRIAFVSTLKTKIAPKSRIKIIEQPLGKGIDFAAVLTDLDDNDYLILDARVLMYQDAINYLCDALRNRQINFMVGKGPTARSVRMSVENFHCIIFTENIELVNAGIRTCMELIL